MITEYGKITYYNYENNYGSIYTNSRKVIYFHKTDVRFVKPRKLIVGEKVVCVSGNDRDDNFIVVVYLA